MTEFDAMGDLLESLGYPEWADKVRSLAWVAVEDRLPPPADVEDEYQHWPQYLLWCDHGDDWTGYAVGSHVGDGQFEEGYRTIFDVTHWRALPDPPHRDLADRVAARHEAALRRFIAREPATRPAPPTPPPGSPASTRPLAP